MYRLNADGQISVGERCVDSQDGVGITIIYCPVKPSGPWRYDEVGLSKNNINMQFLYSALSSNELKILCLFLSPENAHTDTCSIPQRNTQPIYSGPRSWWPLPRDAPYLMWPDCYEYI